MQSTFDANATLVSAPPLTSLMIRSSIPTVCSFIPRAAAPVKLRFYQQVFASKISGDQIIRPP